MAGSVSLANGAQCICGNKDPVKFRQYRRNIDDELLGSFCMNCNTEYLREEIFLDNVNPIDNQKEFLLLGGDKFFQAEKLDQTDSGVHMVHKEKTKIEGLSLIGDYLKPGDHVAWERPYVIWHHALVVDVDPQRGRLLVIHWHGKSKTECRIIEEWLDLSKEWGTLYRMNYEKDFLAKNPLQLVLARARSRIGDYGYQFFGDNCEAFVTYCKKGVAQSQQVAYLIKALSDRVLVALGDLTTRAISKVLMKSFGKVGTAEGIESVANHCQWVGFGLVIIIEGSLTIYDLNEQYDSRKVGSLSRKDFTELAAKRSTEAILTGALAALGGLTPHGFFIGTIGAVLGKLTGSWIGGPLGKVVSSLLDYDDRAVHSIDELHLGDHIVFYGNIVHPKHHCIVLYHDEQDNKVNVIHNTYEHGVIQEWVDFKPPFYKVIYADDKDCHPPDVVCNKAISKLGTNDYNLFTNNCKHFCFWCKKI